MNLSNPHDKLFKAILQDQTLAVDYFNHFLPANIAAQIDFDKLKLNNSSYIDENLSGVYADIVFSCCLKTNAESIEIALLLEHKSYADRNAPFQILYYMASAWMQRVANKQEPQLIVPILLYHGKEPWKYATTADYFSEIPAKFQHYVPNFDFVFTNLQEKTDEDMWTITNQFLAANFLAMKHYHEPEWLVKNLHSLLSQFIAGKSKINSQFYVYVLNFVKLKKQEIMEVLLTLPAEQKSEIMSTYDLLIEEGLIKGRQEGRQEGRREGARKKTIEMVCAAHSNGIELEVIAKIANLPLGEVQQIIQDSTID